MEKVDANGRARGRRALCVVLFGLLAACALGQIGPKSTGGTATPVQVGSTAESETFTDVVPAGWQGRKFCNG